LRSRVGMFCYRHGPGLSHGIARRAERLKHFSALARNRRLDRRNRAAIARILGYVPKTLEPWGLMMERFEGERESFHDDRRALTRVTPESKIWAAVDNETRNELLGMAEVADFSGLGVGLRGMSGDPVAAAGDTLWVTLIAEEGLIPLRARLIRTTRE